MGWDRGLLQRFRDGEPTALAEVFRTYTGALTRMLRAAHRSSTLELENTVLEVFARAFEPRARLSYDGIRPYEAFLMGIARNVLLEQARSRESPAGMAEELEAQLEASTSERPMGVDELMEDREVEQLLESFRAELSEQDRRLYELRFTQGVAQEAAADAMGLSRIQLRRREVQLKRSLLAFLKEKGYLREMEASGWGFFRRRVGT